MFTPNNRTKLPMKVVGFVYARLDSTRLPNKALSKIGDKRLIDIVMDRAKLADFDDIILLTSDRKYDNFLADSVIDRGYQVVRGHASDLVSRTVLALEHTKADVFARINGDSPLQDKHLLNLSIQHASPNRLTSNILVRKYPYGVSVELVGKKLYSKYLKECCEAEREHVTRHLYRLAENHEKVSIEGADDQSMYTCTVDTAEQLQNLRNLMKHRAWNTSYQEVLRINPNKTTVKYNDL